MLYVLMSTFLVEMMMMMMMICLLYTSDAADE